MSSYLPQIISSVITLVIATILRAVLITLIRKYGHLYSGFERHTAHIIRICTIFVNLATIIGLIVIWGVDTRNLVVALSSVFAVIGVALFAQWSILSNITAGIIIFFTTPFRIGDHIRLLDKDMPLEAKVEDIFTFYTHLRTRDGGLHIFPNSLLLQKAISVIPEDNTKPEDYFPEFNNTFEK